MRFVFCSLILLFAPLLSAKTLVVSDLDDTLRLTHRTGPLLEQIENVTDPHMVFTGLPQIFKDFQDHQATIAYVSGTVSPISEFAADFLSTNLFPQQENFYFRGWFQSTVEFKIATIQDLINQERPDDIILLGDNGEDDVTAYDELMKTNPHITVYIHKLYEQSGKAVPSTQGIFITGADLALQLFKHGQISSQTAEEAIAAVAQDVESNDSYKMDLVIPYWAELTPENVSEVFAEKTSFIGKTTELSLIEAYAQSLTQ